MDKQPEIITISEASRLLGCHPNTLRMWERKGILKPVRFGIRRDRKYRKSDVLLLLEGNGDKKKLENTVLPSDYDLTRIDMTGTHYEGLAGETLAKFKKYDDINRQTINKFDFKKFMNDYNSRIQDFPQIEIDKYPSLGEKILHIITATRYRNGSLETINLDKYKVSFLKKIEYFIKRNKPIELMLPAFPFKIANPLKSSRGDADLAEVAAFCRFNEINLQIKKFYKSGAQIHIFHDGHLYYRHFLHELDDANRYFGSLKKFIKLLGLEKIVILHDAFEELKKIKNFDSVCKEARKEITNLWESEKFSNEKIQRIIQSAHNNIKLSNIPYDNLYKINFAEDWDLTAEEKKKKKEIAERAEKCAFEYMVVQHSLEKVDFFNKMVPHGIRLTVHPKDGHIGIYLVKRKTYLLPWMGVGVIKNDGEISVHYESELISNGKYRPVFIKGEKYPFYYKEAEIIYK
ncbi:MAG: L-tyrosine/L-tryptophan isonitrile synthase family protein, partial [bacterium]|nr:L-tyrosine/L-tryptophan isonitrile synthase family protein [bacterium]